MRAEPPCDFDEPQLGQDPPALCTARPRGRLYDDNFNHPNKAGAGLDGQPRGHRRPTSTSAEWDIVDNLPDDRSGKAFFAPDQDYTCNPFTFEDQTVVRHLDSPLIKMPVGTRRAPRLTFVHWFATEPGWDGGNVRISVNGGPWTLIANADFIYNGYTQLLFRASLLQQQPARGPAGVRGDRRRSTGGTWGRSIVNLAPVRPRRRHHPGPLRLRQRRLRRADRLVRRRRVQVFRCR